MESCRQQQEEVVDVHRGTVSQSDLSEQVQLNSTSLFKGWQNLGQSVFNPCVSSDCTREGLMLAESSAMRYCVVLFSDLVDMFDGVVAGCFLEIVVYV